MFVWTALGSVSVSGACFLPQQRPCSRRMTLAELIDMQRTNLEDESVGIRRSWEETFRYTLKYAQLGSNCHQAIPRVSHATYGDLFLRRKL